MKPGDKLANPKRIQVSYFWWLKQSEANHDDSSMLSGSVHEPSESQADEDATRRLA